MYEKQEYNKLYSEFFMRMFREGYGVKLKNKSDRINSCLDVWVWDEYQKNKLLDLKKVNRCNNNRFCSNCKTLDAARFIHYIKPQIQKLIYDDYIPMLLTLTVPNCSGSELVKTLNSMNYTFRKFFEKFNTLGRNAFALRHCRIFGCLRTLEITHNDLNDSYHPHFHCLIFLKDVDQNLLRKIIKGRYSKKNNAYNYHSKLEIQFMKIWSMLYKKIRLTQKNYNLHPDDPFDDQNLVIDLRPLDIDGIYEVVKYTVKDVDMTSYKVFKVYVIALENRRIRQTYGDLLDFDEENFDVGEYQELELEIEEDPEQLIVQDITELFTKYKEYKKISRFQPNGLDETSKLID